MKNIILNCDVLEGLKQLESESINYCVTSPPYFKLRDYGVDDQIGLEKTPEEYIQKLVAVFTEVFRVLSSDGTLWINIGDCYAGSGKGAAADPENAKKYKQGTNRGSVQSDLIIGNIPGNCKRKDLIGIPWMLAFALRSAGWYLRQDIIWSKPNPMPESVKDRCTRSHEYIFLFSKSEKYFYDNEKIKEPAITSDKNCPRGSKGTLSLNKGLRKQDSLGKSNYTGFNNRYESLNMKNKRDVWTICPKGYKGAHFATFPQELVRPCVKAGCPKGGIVLDPFSGSGTTALTALEQECNYIGIELNTDYVKLSEKRINEYLKKDLINKKNQFTQFSIDDFLEV